MVFAKNIWIDYNLFDIYEGVSIVGFEDNLINVSK